MGVHYVNRREFGSLSMAGLALGVSSLAAAADGPSRAPSNRPADKATVGGPVVGAELADRKTHDIVRPTIEEPCRKIPVAADVDVVVAGGGPAGFVAAIAAARTGARTLLLERYGFLGGGLTAGGVLNIRPFHVAPGKVLMDGIPLEYVRRLQKMGGTRFLPDYIPIQQDPELSKYVIQEMVLEAGVQLLLHSYLVGVVRNENRLSAVLIENKSGRQAIRGKVFVDCTGDADVAWHAGAPWVKGDAQGNLQPMTLAFALSNVVRPANAAMSAEDQKALNAARAAKSTPLASGGFLPMIAPDEVYANAMHVEADCTDAQSLPRAEIEGRRKAVRILETLRERLPGCKNARFRYTATHIGPRESRRIVGEYTLRVEDVLRRADFDDAVCRGHHPIDVHAEPPHKGVYRVLPPGHSYAIPARCLVAQGIDNLLAAGRCISADREALGSARVQGTCMATGQAAGSMAALAAKRQCAVRDVPFGEIKNALAFHGTHA